MFLNNIVKSKNARTAREFKKRKPLVYENDKNALFVWNGQAPQRIKNILRELEIMKRPFSLRYSLPELKKKGRKKNSATDANSTSEKSKDKGAKNKDSAKNSKGPAKPFRPLEDPSRVEEVCQKSDCSLFMSCYDSKKRPNTLLIGRTFDHQALDMFELEIEKFQSLHEFKNAKVPTGAKPCLIFCGDAFEATEEHRRLKNLLADFFRGPKVSHVSLTGFEHTLSFALVGSKLYMRSYRILLKKSGTNIPLIDLEEVGPSLDLKLKRMKIASEDMFKQACKVPAEAKIKKKKNISQDGFGSKVGQIHMQVQDYTELTTKKGKGFKRKREAGDRIDGKGKKKVKTNKADEEAMEVEEEQ